MALYPGIIQWTASERQICCSLGSHLTTPNLNFIPPQLGPDRVLWNLNEICASCSAATHLTLPVVSFLPSLPMTKNRKKETEHQDREQSEGAGSPCERANSLYLDDVGRSSPRTEIYHYKPHRLKTALSLISFFLPKAIHISKISWKYGYIFNFLGCWKNVAQSDSFPENWKTQFKFTLGIG